MPMIEQSEGKMFLAGERGYAETSWFRRYSTFNFEEFKHEHKIPFGPLHVFNEETLAGRKKLTFVTEDDNCIILLPTAGAIYYSDSLCNEMLVQAGEVLVVDISKDMLFMIENPFETELVNYLQLWIKKTVVINTKVRKNSFDIDRHKNKLVSLISEGLGETEHLFFKGFIGKLDGRTELIYDLSNPDHKAFVFVLEGAFEVQYRLLESKDGLALWNTRHIELEALSNGAIILVFEMCFKDHKD